MPSNLKFQSEIGIRDYYDQFKVDYNNSLINLNTTIEKYDTSRVKIEELIQQTNNSKYIVIRTKILQRLLALRKSKAKLKQRKNVTGILYSDIIRLYYKELVLQILRGYKFRLGYKLGTLKVVKVFNRAARNYNGEYKHRTDWGNTTKTKEQLLKDGVKKEELLDAKKLNPIREEYEKQGFNEIEAKYKALDDKRSGITYMKFFTDDYYYWARWHKVNIGIPYLNLYSFIPARTFARDISSLRHREDIEGVFDVIETNLFKQT